jgi:hypothetical protein
VAGTTYRILVAGDVTVDHGAGGFDLRLHPPEASLHNDAFAAATVLTGSNTDALRQDVNTGATKEPNEPAHLPGNAGGSSIGTAGWRRRAAR